MVLESLAPTAAEHSRPRRVGLATVRELVAVRRALLLGALGVAHHAAHDVRAAPCAVAHYMQQSKQRQESV